MSLGSTVIIKNLTKKTKDVSVVQPARMRRLLLPQHTVASYPAKKNRIETNFTKFILKGPESTDTPNHSEQNPTESDIVSPDRTQELPPEEATVHCGTAPSPVKAVKRFSDVDLNVYLAKQSIQETL